MTYSLKKTLIAFTVLVPSFILANTSQTMHSIHKSENTKALAIYYSYQGNIEKAYNQFVAKKLKSIGFNVTDPHKRVNDQYEAKYGSTTLDILSFMPIVKDSVILPLLNIDPRIAGFAPFNLVIHKQRDDNATLVGHLLPNVMLDILGIDNAKVRKKFSASFRALDATISQNLGGHIATIPYKALPKKRMINYEYSFKSPKNMEDFIDDFQEKFEVAFTKKGYLIAGYHNFMEATDDAPKILSDYHAFWTYSLCHLEFSYNMFDKEGARPEAGLFAPCTMYMYIKKNTNTVVIGMPRLHNWSDSLDIKDPSRLALIEKLDTQIPAILESLGMKPVPNTNPLLTKKSTKAVQPSIEKTKIPKEVHHAIQKQSTPTQKYAKTQNVQVGNKSIAIAIPTVPKVIKCNSKSYSAGKDRSIKFSKRIPPNYKAHSFEKAQKAKTSTHTRIGEVNHGKISAYLRGKFMTVDAAKEKLQASGFEVIATTPVNKQADLISIVFTDKALVAMASKENRGFMASLRLLVDTKAKNISITNPLYLAKGFLQNDFDETSANKVLDKLLTHFTDLSNSKDTLKFQLLPKYQFMKGMPYFQDMVEVASGKNLLEKIKNNDKVVFTQTLDNGATLIGIKLSKRTRKFTKKIGRENAAMLPYPILIENGKAKILDPKYYISLMYPMLSMSQFMTIATVPDAMIKDCEKVFK